MKSQSRQFRKENTRTEIVAAALALFAARGFAGTTTADIAAASGISHGTVFVHFKTRDELIVAVIDSFGAGLAVAFDQALANETSLEGVLRAHLEVIAGNEDFYHRLQTELYALPAGVQSTVFMLNAAVSCRLFDTARPRMESGEFKAITRPLLFNTWIAIVNYYIAHRDKFSVERPILRPHGKGLIDHFLMLIKQ